MSSAPDAATGAAPTTRVWFVGAGPGDPELLTRKAARLLAAADVVLHDALVHPEVLALAPQARLLDVGKRACRPSTAQRFIDRALVAAARRHACVVRLKGGDPAIFGRLDEEIDALVAAGFAYEVVPGVTTASAAAAQLGTSLTKRGVARALTLLTPRVAAGLAPSDWAAAARGDTTLAVYMAGREIAQTAAALLVQGLPADTPLAVLESVSLPQARTWRGTLAGAARAAPATGSGPVLVLVGAALRSAATGAAAQSAGALAAPRTLRTGRPAAMPVTRAA